MDYRQIASNERVEKTISALSQNNFKALKVGTKEEALELVKSLIPEGASVMNGSSTTLQEIGFVDYLKSGEHKWNNLHENILKETDPVKQMKLRQESVLSDFYLGSAHSITEEGEIVVASNTGSQLPHLVFTSKNIILVVGTQKISKDLSDAMNRIKEAVIPMEDERMNKVYGFGTTWAKTLVLHKENPNMGRSVNVIFVDEVLGF
jgi:L-lactate utilization protein LutB